MPPSIGFVEAGVSLGVTFAFLVSAPMVNEVAPRLIWGLFGSAIAVAHLVAGLLVAVGAGFVVSQRRAWRTVGLAATATIGGSRGDGVDYPADGSGRPIA